MLPLCVHMKCSFEQNRGFFFFLFFFNVHNRQNSLQVTWNKVSSSFLCLLLSAERVC